eukprot:CAMPEP_0172710446 /NCGR_PEP_ID=MMETSP1074-20121228/55666_1 /TAXON_ID=2916 /ORGANISM="Ceratium fusus, Strain PA161109" /LENGTH=191 /DNA_ID=CAMNT_0013533849 /DNA_START=9 /DNA_END=584 /DNA_ORIENTATION=+
MIAAVSSFGVGVAVRRKLAECCPCQARCGAGRTFKLSVCIHTVSLETHTSPKGHQRPFVTISTAGKEKRTEPGDWLLDEKQWGFQESLTVEVSDKDEVLISMCCPQKMDLGVAAVSLSARQAGDVCVPVASVLPQLQPESRDFDGLVYTTPKIFLDLHKDGAKTGRAMLSFETKQVPPGIRDPGEIDLTSD